MAAVVGAIALVAACSHGGGRPDIVVGRSTTTAASPSSTIAIVGDPGADPTSTSPPAAAGLHRAPNGGLVDADGHPYGTVVAFTSSIPVPTDLVFVLAVGSDARPGEDMLRTNADSLHLLAINPRTRQGTVMGIPRDAWVDIPGHGHNKINSAMQYGGPKLLAATVNRLTGLPVQYYVVTGFGGLPAIVDELGGVDVYVDRRMDDAASGARFQPGWHHFTGAQALAFSRDRHDQPNGDFDRSRHQGELLLAGLAKMRAEVGDEDGIRRWAGVLLRHAGTDGSSDAVVQLGSLARRLDPAQLHNVVVPGRVGYAGSESVVYLGADAAALFEDLRPDAVVGGAGPDVTDPTTTTSTTSTSEAPTTTLVPPSP